jgi:hypothetical protein
MQRSPLKQVELRSLEATAILTYRKMAEVTGFFKRRTGKARLSNADRIPSALAKNKKQHP